MRALFRSLFALPSDPTAEGTLAGWLFLRGLGLIYLIAFLSLWPQLLGLIGSDGMMPAAPFLKAVAQKVGASRLYLLPTLLWFGSEDAALRLICGLGAFFSLLLLIGSLELLALAGAWACYLSLVSAGRDFLSFQWDALLLESAVFSLPLLLQAPTLRPTLRPVCAAARGLLFLLLFRFMFAAGWAKLRSGDPAWRDLSALSYHFFTQPLPTLLAYYVQKLPQGVLSAGTLFMFIIELGVPFLILFPRLRRHAFAPLVALQLAIAATGNYGFFNLLTMVLCIPLLPDSWLRRIHIERVIPQARRSVWQRGSRMGMAARAGLFLVLCSLASLQVALLFVDAAQLPRAARFVLRKTAPFALANHYGLFAVMTKERKEIILEGSRDGKIWIPYEFSYKPGALYRPPRWNAPHQPRLDWQLWFAALGSREESPWFDGLCIRLLQGSPDVLRLLPSDPFAGQPPRYLRATLYDYRFTTLAEKRRDGAYFHRADPEPYLPAVSLDGR